MPPSGTPAVDLVVRAGIAHRVHAYATDRHVAAGAPRPGYGLEAAAALGVDPARMFKTLVATVDGDRLVAAVVPVDRQLDPKRLAAAVGGRSAALAEPGHAERASGSVIGGISPLGCAAGCRWSSTRRRCGHADGLRVGRPARPAAGAGARRSGASRQRDPRDDRSLTLSGGPAIGDRIVGRWHTPPRPPGHRHRQTGSTRRLAAPHGRFSATRRVALLDDRAPAHPDRVR